MSKPKQINVPDIITDEFIIDTFVFLTTGFPCFIVKDSHLKRYPKIKKYLDIS